MITISLNQIRAHGPCLPGWEKLLKSLGKTKADDEEFPFSYIVKSNGLDDAIWAFRCLEDQTPTQLFTIACAQEALRLMEDKRSIEAVKLAHLFAYGEIDKKTLDAAGAEARSVVGAAARSAAWTVSWADTWDAAKSASSDASKAAAKLAFRAAVGYASKVSSRAAARFAAWNAPWIAARERQCEWLIAIADNYEA